MSLEIEFLMQRIQQQTQIEFDKISSEKPLNIGRINEQKDRLWKKAMENCQSLSIYKLMGICSLKFACSIIQITRNYMTQNISPFIEKLQQILNDPLNSDVINFTETNSRLEIFNKKKLENILPKYFRHGRFQSFVRQLNWYGFYKINNKAINCYSHPDLEKGVKLCAIKSRRKSLGSKSMDERKDSQCEYEAEVRFPKPQTENKTLAMLIPLENKTPYNPIHIENQYFIVDPFKMGMYSNFPQPCQLFYTFECPSFHSGR